MSDVTYILSQIEQGDPEAADKLLPLVYDELRKLAAVKLAQEKPGQTLQATALVHEAYLRLVGGAARSEVRDQKSEESQPTTDLRPPTSSLWNSRRHFFSAAAESMQRILIESARRKKRLKRGGQWERADLPDVPEFEHAPLDDLIDLDQALRKFALEDQEKAAVVKLHFFAGLQLEEISQILGVSVPTIKRHWRYARAWLHKELHAGNDPDSARL